MTPYKKLPHMIKEVVAEFSQEQNKMSETNGNGAAIPEAAQASQPSEEPKKETKEEKLARLEKELKGMLHVEKAIRIAASQYAKKMSVREDHFRITLVGQLEKGDTFIMSGPVVEIYFKYPQPVDKWGPMIRSALGAISRRPAMRTPVEIVPVGWYKSQEKERRKWHREKFGDMGDIIMNMIPRDRCIEEVVVTHTLRDRLTGLEVSVSYPEGKRMPYDVQREMRVNLTRIVQSIEIDEDEVEIDNNLASPVFAREDYPMNPLGDCMWLYDKEDFRS